MGKVACWAFVGSSIVALCLVPFFPLAPGPLGILGFVLAIPAVPYFMPYWIGVNLAMRAGEASVAGTVAKAA